MTGRQSGAWRPGRDPRAVRHPGPPGRQRTSEPRRVAVVGGGIAGLAAATGLAERGLPVTVLEGSPRLGGRVAAWPLGDGRTMSRGFHAFFRQYYNLRALLRRADPALDRLVPIADYPLLAASGQRDSFASVPHRPPLNVIGFVVQSPSFGLRELVKVNVPAAIELLQVDFPGTFSAYDGESAAAFLDRLRFPPPARHLALEVFARSFFAPPERFAAAELVAMFHSYFLGSAEGLLFDVPADDYDTALWAPLGRYLAALGVEVRTGTTVAGVERAGDGVRLDLGWGEDMVADAVVLAADPAGTRRLVAGSQLGNRGWREQLAATENAPPFAVWRLWLDRPVAADRPAFLGTSGFGPLDNVTVLERYEAGARRWAVRHRGSVVEVHAYALAEESLKAHRTLPDGVPVPRVKAELGAALQQVYPETAAAGVLAEEWLVQADCALVGTEPWQLRPTVSTPDPRVVLAGDHVRCDLPVALMERAATTGLQAANTLLAGWGLAGHDLWTVPMRGLLGSRRRGQAVRSR